MPGVACNTLINTSNGFKLINEISVNDCALNENNEFKKIIDIKTQEVNETYRLKGMCFDELICSENQKFLVREKTSYYDKITGHWKRCFAEPKWKCAKDIVRGDYMCISINNNSSLPKWSGSYYNQFGHHRLIDTLTPLFKNPSFGI